MNQYELWNRTLGEAASSNFPAQLSKLREAFLEFRGRVAHLVGEIGGLLPDLTVHDITHLDSLWRIANQIAGPNYPLNPAEAFVLGGAFLLHDSAHVLAAYDGKLEGLKNTTAWKDLVAQQLAGVEPIPGSKNEKSIIFQVLRQLHAERAKELPKIKWKTPGLDEFQYLLENSDLRNYYGDLIGEIAESHHWSPEQVAAIFENRKVSAPAFLAPADWTVDALKVALLLRTSDAAHIDGLRAPWFLFALRQPTGVSYSHWKFQSKIGQPLCNLNNELELTSGSTFGIEERQAWWLAYETACMIDRELQAAYQIMRDARRDLFYARRVAKISTPALFSTGLRTSGWEPVDIAPKISNVPRIISNLGGAKLYGDRPELALREIIQNSSDAVRAHRAFLKTSNRGGELEVSLSLENSEVWLHVVDTGIGMSRHVLTNVLLDFGNSIWSDDALRAELPGLASTGFKSIGKFGIGFFSIFILGDRVRVTTKRFRKSQGDDSDQWILDMEQWPNDRPILRKPTVEEELPQSGTKVSVQINASALRKIIGWKEDKEIDLETLKSLLNSTDNTRAPEIQNFFNVISNLCPSLDIEVYAKFGANSRKQLIAPDDWLTLDSKDLIRRLYGKVDYSNDKQLVELQEPSGEIMGRIAYSSRYFSEAIVTHEGIRSGNVRGLIGLLKGSNNKDLARSASSTAASAIAWKVWAETMIESGAVDTVNALVNLHPLSRDLDLEVFQRNNERLSQALLEKFISTTDQIIVYLGWPDHQDSDDMSESRFNSFFAESAEVLFIPEKSGQFAEPFGQIKPINYQARLEASIQKIWGEFEIQEIDDYVVGEVNGNEILRSVIMYSPQEIE